jgi:hypothetical protein
VQEFVKKQEGYFHLLLFFGLNLGGYGSFLVFIPLCGTLDRKVTGHVRSFIVSSNVGLALNFVTIMRLGFGLDVTHLDHGMTRRARIPRRVRVGARTVAMRESECVEQHVCVWNFSCSHLF